MINYNRMKFMLRPDKTSAALAGKVVDIYDFPDGRLEILQPTPQDNQLISKRRVSQLHALT